MDNGYTKVPKIINIELTSKCPLRCPQCYCSLENGEDIPKKQLFHYIDQAAELGVKTLCFSGGEALVYPYLDESIAYAQEQGLESYLATSGYRMTEKRLRTLLSNGLSQLFISLNGSCPEVHNLSRQGYDEGMTLLKLAKKVGVDVVINWVARKDNYKDFTKLLALLKEYPVKQVVVLMLKPDASHQLKEGLFGDEYEAFKDELRKNVESDVPFVIERCYTYLNADVGKIGVPVRRYTGCQAGISTMSISLKGLFTPCRHLPIEEAYESISSYWTKSETLEKLRKASNLTEDQCSTCDLLDRCHPCKALAYKLKDDLMAGFDGCPVPLYKRKDIKLKF